jgi:hypothetical protein
MVITNLFDRIGLWALHRLARPTIPGTMQGFLLDDGFGKQWLIQRLKTQ